MHEDRTRLLLKFGRRDFLRYAGVVAGGAVLVGCRRDEAAAPVGAGSPSPTLTRILEDEPGDLHVYEWSGYEIEELWQPFKEQFPDIKPEFTFLTSPDEALSKIAGGFSADLVHPELSFMQEFIELGVFQPFDTSLLSTFPALNPALVEAGQFDGQQYAIPLDWGFVSVLYRRDKVEQSDSFALLFDQRYEGKISWHDHPWMLVIAGYILGVDDPWAMTAEEMEAAQAYAIENKNVVRNLWVSATDMYQDIISGNVWISYAWPDALVATQAEGIDTEYMFPREGAISWVEGFMLFADTENYLHAHEYVDAWASTVTGEWLMANYLFGHANTGIDTSDLDPSVVDVFHVDDPTFLEEPNSHVAQPMQPRSDYARAWDAVKAA